jgi:hypothetical protein
MRLAQSGFNRSEFITTVQPSLLGTIAIVVPAEQSSDDFSPSWKIQTSSVAETLVLVMLTPPVYSGRVKENDLRRYKPPVHMVTLTKGREIAPYVWGHPDDDDRR